MPTQQQVLHSPFNIKTHKKTFVRYFEAVIGPDGVVEYAVPSHQEKLVNVLAKQLNTDKQGVFDACPRRYYLDMHTWLTESTGYIMVWEGFYIGKPNEAQLETLRSLKKADIYLGGIGEPGKVLEFANGAFY